MGLDMYLNGEQYFREDWHNPANNHIENGFRMTGKTFRLGYWRKHPDLHGFIVDNFAEADDCKPIYLETKSIEQIIKAIAEDRLPHTEGFFFGESTNDEAEKSEAIEIFAKALEWLRASEHDRSIYYQASW